MPWDDANERHRRHMPALRFRLDQRLVDRAPREDIYRTLAHGVQRVSRGNGALVVERENDRSRLVAAAEIAHGDSAPLHAALRRHAAPWVRERMTMLDIDDWHADERWLANTGEPMPWASLLCAPLYGDMESKRPNAVLAVGSRQPQSFDEADRRFTAELASLVSEDLQASTFGERLFCRKDTLTSARSRWYLVEELPAQLTWHQREEQPLSLCFIDIDRLKAHHDMVGHRGSDQIIIEVARRLQAPPSGRHLVHLTPGLFALMLPSTGTNEALHLLDDLRRRLASRPVEVDTGVDDYAVDVTVSVGLTAARADDQKAPELVQRATDALLLAKTRGRNRVIVL